MIYYIKTNDIEEVLNDIFDAFDFYNRWQTTVSEIYEGKPLQTLIDDSHEVFMDPLTIFDSGNVLTLLKRVSHRFF